VNLDHAARGEVGALGGSHETGAEGVIAGQGSLL
jgi:hypothetical protein